MDDFIMNFGLMNLRELQNVTDIVFDDNYDTSSECEMVLEKEDTVLQIKTDEEKRSIVNYEPPYGCKHYLRSCMIKASCCNKFFSCRFCHDEFFEAKKDGHKIDRFQTEIIKCTKCGVEQEVNDRCKGCGVNFGLYFCEKCRIWDDICKDQYHCDKCGICRVEKTLSYHCDGCNTCLNKNMVNNHKCVDAKDSLCPICLDDIFLSTINVMTMKCGHAIHQKCLMTYLQTNYKCPICSQSIVDTTEYNKLIDREIELTPMPEEYKDAKIRILCNDCHDESDVNYHIVALKCCFCNSYNTRRI